MYKVYQGKLYGIWGRGWHERRVAPANEHRRTFGDSGSIVTHHAVAVLALPVDHGGRHGCDSGGARSLRAAGAIDRQRYVRSEARRAERLDFLAGAWSRRAAVSRRSASRSEFMTE